MKKVNLSTNRRYEFDIDATAYTTYAGQLALPYVTAAVKTPDTIAKGYIRTMDGLNKSAHITNIGIDGGEIQAANCSFQDGASSSLTEQVLTLTDLKVNEEICRGTIFPTWIGQGMDRNGNLPQSFSNFLLETVAANVAQGVENAIWRGSSVFGQGFCSNDGTLDEAGADASACKDFFEVDLTDPLATNDILTDMASVYNSVVANCPGILSKPGFGFYVNQKTYAIYAQKLASETTFQALGSAGNFEGLTYMGFPLYVCPGMFNDTIIATYPDNLVFGTNLATDWTEVSLIPTWQYDGSDNVRVVMKWAMGVQTAVGTDGVFATSVWT